MLRFVEISMQQLYVNHVGDVWTVCLDWLLLFGILALLMNIMVDPMIIYYNFADIIDMLVFTKVRNDDMIILISVSIIIKIARFILV